MQPHKKTKAVRLTLEETGWLIHRLVKDMLDIEEAANRRSIHNSAVMTPTVYASIHTRMLALYTKLSDANDELMGKNK